MIKFRLYIDPSVFKPVYDLPKKAEQQFRNEMQSKVRPAVQREVDRTVGRTPGPVKRPFEFATDRSRRAYFATNGFGKGLPYRRTGQLEASWIVAVGTQLRSPFVLIYNNKTYGKYVYGPRQVPGHRRTGWGKDIERDLNYLTDFTEEQIVQTWGRAVDAAVKDTK